MLSMWGCVWVSRRSIFNDFLKCTAVTCSPMLSRFWSFHESLMIWATLRRQAVSAMNIGKFKSDAKNKEIYLSLLRFTLAASCPCRFQLRKKRKIFKFFMTMSDVFLSYLYLLFVYALLWSYFTRFSSCSSPLHPHIPFNAIMHSIQPLLLSLWRWP